ncbi:hypothetical protein RRG08_038637 [Elysia crispata]|uniref:Uncharacterized protein n=1 Tax=Elysia crispata TaxID=231223 RepID=A0AAE0YKU6_9GAST|nr:hypothetical protein RRG08_038637 [Elysia crispata]
MLLSPAATCHAPTDVVVNGAEEQELASDERGEVEGGEERGEGKRPLGKDTLCLFLQKRQGSNHNFHKRQISTQFSSRVIERIGSRGGGRIRREKAVKRDGLNGKSKPRNKTMLKSEMKREGAPKSR